MEVVRYWRELQVGVEADVEEAKRVLQTAEDRKIYGRKNLGNVDGRRGMKREGRNRNAPLIDSDQALPA